MKEEHLKLGIGLMMAAAALAVLAWYQLAYAGNSTPALVKVLKDARGNLNIARNIAIEDGEPNYILEEIENGLFGIECVMNRLVNRQVNQPPPPTHLWVPDR